MDSLKQHRNLLAKKHSVLTRQICFPHIFFSVSPEFDSILKKNKKLYQKINKFKFKTCSDPLRYIMIQIQCLYFQNLFLTQLLVIKNFKKRNSDFSAFIDPLVGINANTALKRLLKFYD